MNKPPIYGLMAEFKSPTALVEAAGAGAQANVR